MILSNIENIIFELYSKNIIIIFDKKNRENEGDLIISTDFLHLKHINFMIKYAKGLICLSLTKKFCNKLNLPNIIYNKKNKTNFISSIEASFNITTGISSLDRIKTIKIATYKYINFLDIIYPGHIFPLYSKNGGILNREGHTEISCNLSKITGLKSTATICEIIKNNGKMARLLDLFKFSKKYLININNINNIIKFIKKYYIYF